MRSIGKPFLAMLVIAVVLLAGCGAKPAATPAAGQPAAPAATQPPAPAATEAAAQPPVSKSAEVSQPTPEATAEPTAEEEVLDLEDRENGLEGLKSYRATWSYEWIGKKDGKDQTVKWVISEARTSEPVASHFKMESTDSLEPTQSGALEMIQIGKTSYMISNEDGKESCTPFSSEDNKPAESLSPGSFGSIRGGKYLGQETVNGIRTKHYRYDEKATGVTGFTRLAGDVWVAVDGAFAVKDVANWEGRLFGAADATEAGKGSWSWELTDVNAAFEITPPPGCQSQAEGLPVMSDATEQSVFGDMVSYKTKSKLADAVKFYQTEMPKAGWAVEGEAMVSEQFASLAFTKDGKKASIMLSPDNEMTSVLITVEK